MQAPSHVDVSSLRRALLALPALLDVHHLHVWSPSPSSAVAMMHVSLRSGSDADAACDAIRAICHRSHVHATTIQVERVPDMIGTGGPSLPAAPGQYRCLSEPVCPDPACVTSSCCPATDHHA